MKVEERFWSKVDKSGECWEWTASVTNDGYGRFWCGGSMAMAHRVAWHLFVDSSFELSPGYTRSDMIVVDHICRNRCCVNPEHLRLLTQHENNDSNRRKTECIHGHPFDAANTLVLSRGTRHCRRCHADRNRKYAKAKREVIPSILVSQ